MFVAEVHHLLLDACRLVVENDGDDTYQIAVFEFLVLELAEEVSRGFTKDLTTTSVAVFLREFVDSFEQFFWH